MGRCRCTYTPCRLAAPQVKKIGHRHCRHDFAVLHISGDHMLGQHRAAHCRPTTLTPANLPKKSALAWDGPKNEHSPIPTSQVCNNAISFAAYSYKVYTRQAWSEANKRLMLLGTCNGVGYATAQRCPRVCIARMAQRVVLPLSVSLKCRSRKKHAHEVLGHLLPNFACGGQAPCATVTATARWRAARRRTQASGEKDQSDFSDGG